MAMTAKQFSEAIKAHVRAEKAYPLEEQRKRARARLLKEGIIRERPDGTTVLHQNYGGPDDR